MKKALTKVFIAIFVASLFFPLLSSRTESANLTTLSDTMSRLKLSASSNHTIVFTTPSGVAALQKIKVTFAAGFSLTGVVFGDIDLLDDGSDLTLAGTCSGTTWGAAVASQVITFTSCSGTIAASSVITIKIGTNAAGPGVHQITNPGSSGSNVINLAITTAADADVDTGALAVAIMDEDQITVTATVNPSITSVLSGAGYPTCALGTLTISQVYGCTYINTVNTNATSGYSASLTENHNPQSGADDINDSDGTVNANNEEYGIASSDTTNTAGVADYDGACGGGASELASAIVGTETYANDTGPVSGQATTVCHAAAVSGTTPAGSYSHTVTHITTGNF